MLYERVMGLLENVDVRVTGLNNTADHLAAKHVEHEKVHQRYKEQTQEKMNDMNIKILEIRQLSGFSKSKEKENVARGAPDGEEVVEKVVNLTNKWLMVAQRRKFPGEGAEQLRNNEK